MTTKKNNYGEKIHIKIENGTIMVHHEDATEDFIDINKFLLNITLDEHELPLLYSAIKEENLPTILKKIKNGKHNNNNC
jgi:hypothetical protein